VSQSGRGRYLDDEARVSPASGFVVATRGTEVVSSSVLATTVAALLRHKGGHVCNGALGQKVDPRL
jgi:hypothetical protein